MYFQVIFRAYKTNCKLFGCRKYYFDYVISTWYPNLTQEMNREIQVIQIECVVLLNIIIQFILDKESLQNVVGSQ